MSRGGKQQNRRVSPRLCASIAFLWGLPWEFSARPSFMGCSVTCKGANIVLMERWPHGVGPGNRFHHDEVVGAGTEVTWETRVTSGAMLCSSPSVVPRVTASLPRIKGQWKVGPVMRVFAHWDCWLDPEEGVWGRGIQFPWTGGRQGPRNASRNCFVLLRWALEFS